MKLQLTLERNGETKELNASLSVHTIREIKQAMKDGWELKDVQGDNPHIVSYIKEQIEKYNQDKEHYKASVMETVKVATSVIKPQGNLKLSKRELLLAKFRRKDK